MIGKYKVISIIGSTRFKNEIEHAAARLTLDGYIVFPLTVFTKADQLTLNDNQLEMLSDMVRKKIDISDEVYVVNSRGYIGSSTRQEIKYALDNNKKVTFSNNNINLGDLNI